MVDVFDAAKRSWVMSRIRGKNTKPELAIRSLLHRLGYRFTVNAPNNRKLPGKPDIVLPKHRTIILVHGCFWHGHEGCRHFRMPKSRRQWWEAKIFGNRLRDQRNLDELTAAGWNVVVIWTCEFDRADKLDALTHTLAARIEPALRPAARAAETPPPYHSGKKITHAGWLPSAHSTPALRHRGRAAHPRTGPPRFRPHGCAGQ